MLLRLPHLCLSAPLTELGLLWLWTETGRVWAKDLVRVTCKILEPHVDQEPHFYTGTCTGYSQLSLVMWTGTFSSLYLSALTAVVTSNISRYKWQENQAPHQIKKWSIPLFLGKWTLGRVIIMDIATWGLSAFRTRGFTSFYFMTVIRLQIGIWAFAIENFHFC